MSVPNLTFGFEVKSFHPTNLNDVSAFIEEHRLDKHRLIVTMQRIGIGDAFADRLEHEGFNVVRLGSYPKSKEMR